MATLACGASPSGFPTDNDTAFASITDLSLVDLVGQTYPVTAIPNINARNGFFKIDNAVGGMSVEFPAPETLMSSTVKLTDGPLYHAWPQDKCHSYNGVIYALWNEGEGHGTNGTCVRCVRSADGGRGWTHYETPFATAGKEIMSFAAGVFEGQQLIVTRQRVSGAIESQRLYGRRLIERRGPITARVVCTSGSPSYSIYIEANGLKAGDTFSIYSASATVGAQELSGKTFTVARQEDAGKVVFNATTGGLVNAGTSEDKTISLIVEFNEGPFTEIKFRDSSGNDVSLGEAILDKSGTLFSSLPEVIQSIAVLRIGPNEADIRIYMGASVGVTNGGVILLEISGLFRGTVQRSISNMTQIGTRTSNSMAEPSVTVDIDTGDLFGFVRTQSTSLSPQFWWSPGSDRSDITTVDLPSGREVGHLSPIPVRVHGDNLYAFLVGDRTNNDTVGDVPCHLLIADKNQAKSGDFSAWRVVSLGSLYRAKTTGNSGIGVPSIAIQDNKIHLFYSDEAPPIPGVKSNLYVSVDVFCTTIALTDLIGGQYTRKCDVLGRTSVCNN